MIKFLFKKYESTLSIDVDNAETSSAHIFDGDKESVALIKKALYFLFSEYGVSLNVEFGTV